MAGVQRLHEVRLKAYEVLALSSMTVVNEAWLLSCLYLPLGGMMTLEPVRSFHFLYPVYPLIAVMNVWLLV